MFTKITKICIVALVIAPILSFGQNVNDEFATKLLPETATPTTTTTTTPSAFASSPSSSSSSSSSEEEEVASVAAMATEGAKAATIITPRKDDSESEGTTSSSSSFETAAATATTPRSEIPSAVGKEEKKVEEDQTPTSPASRTTTEKPANNEMMRGKQRTSKESDEENDESGGEDDDDMERTLEPRVMAMVEESAVLVLNENFASKSRAEMEKTAVASSSTSTSTATATATTGQQGRPGSNGYEEQTQIRPEMEMESVGEKQHTVTASTSTPISTTTTTPRADSNLEPGERRHSELAATNQQEAADPPTPTAADTNLSRQQASATPMAAATTATTSSSSSINNNNGITSDELQQQKLSNGLYRIKLAEIVTDGLGGLLPAEVAAVFGEELKQKLKPKAVEATEKSVDASDYPEGEKTLIDMTSEGPSEDGMSTIRKSTSSSIEDFNPIIRDSNAKLLKERTVFTRVENAAEHRQNLLPNEVEVQQQQQQQQKQQKQQEQLHQTRDGPVKHKTVNRLTVIQRQQPPPTVSQPSPPSSPDVVSEFTGKLLQEQDGVITEIEQKFQLNEFVGSTTAAPDVIKSMEDNYTTSTSTSTSPIRDDSLSLHHRTTTAKTTTTRRPSPRPIPSSSSIYSAAVSATSTNTRRGGKITFSVNHKIRNLPPSDANKTPSGASGGSSAAVTALAGHDFIDRRVKKSFEFPLHRAASDVMAMPHIDFANTKFNTDSGSQGSRAATAAAAAGSKLTAGADARPTDGGSSAGTSTDAMGMSGTVDSAPAVHPEFSTTKFYNSKEFNNGMWQAKREPPSSTTTPNDEETPTAAKPSSTIKPRVHSLQGVKFRTFPKDVPKKGPLILLSPPTKTTTTMLASGTSSSAINRVSLTPTIITTTTTTTRETPLKRKKYQKELKRAKLLLKSILPMSVESATASATSQEMAAPVAAATPSTTPVDLPSSPPSSTTTEIPLLIGGPYRGDIGGEPSLLSKAEDADSSSVGDASDPQENRKNIKESTAAAAAVSPSTNANPTKSASKPLARPRILSRLQEKINSLECEIQNVPQDSHLWRGNETHELLLPIVSKAHCINEEANCSPQVVSWEGEAEIQSGDILIVEINDAMLNSNDANNTYSAHNTQVYQVTRSGHEHCDVTEGILLDITPLVVDGRKLVTLYDKDLTEGVNLLIVVSELWGSQCVRLKVTTKTDNCGENADCSGKGVCYSNSAMEEYECQCCSGFAGPHCEEIDACTPSPCTNNGICVDLSQGHEGNSYQCLCPYGYTGKNCQYESDPCNPAECMNGGSCVGNSTHFRCDCTAGYTGPLCQHSLNECESSPCVHGICVDQEDGFRCFCQPGFAGELCNFEYNECESNPCQNSGECIDHIGSYECRCTKGYTGNRCQIKVDFCANKPCPEGHRCIDHGNDYSCECPGGRNGPDCNQMPRTQCNVNPCTHGGTCWTSGDSFYCACRPGFTGNMCEDEFVVETVVSSSEFIVDDTSARNFNDKTFASSVVLKSPIELHNAYFAAGVLASAIFIVAIVLTICHCKVNQTYRKFSTRTTSFFPILGFGRRPKPTGKLNKHWLSGKGFGTSGGSSGLSATSAVQSAHNGVGGGGGGSGCHLPSQSMAGGGSQGNHQGGQLQERPFQRHFNMSLENDMYYTVDFSENSQHSPLIQ